ncbi:hypothetical protein [Lactococcus formosensis]|uniref:hypothetical protein n=1 Tax=Lactococcus formosensis TaxID=1281486 RepID=UPI0028929EED|nr:hypothetical protein [Lactococcus formosensis]
MNNYIKKLIISLLIIGGALCLNTSALANSNLEVRDDSISQNNNLSDDKPLASATLQLNDVESGTPH